MGRIISYILVLVLIVVGVSFLDHNQLEAENNKPTLASPSEESIIYVSSDWHLHGQDTYFPLEHHREIIEAMIYESKTDTPKALLLAGDLTNNGKLQEHRDLIEILSKAEKDGVRVYVTMGNHDMDSNISASEITEMYGNFGFKEAISTDKDSMSYLAEIDDSLWVMSLDCNVYGDKTSSMAGVISDSTLEWVESSLQLAVKEGVAVLPFSHHNLLQDASDETAVHYNIEGGDKLKELFVEYGVLLHISGHRHGSYTISEHIKGQPLYEAVVDMTTSYPYRYTQLTYNTDGTIGYKVKELDVNSWAEASGVSDEKYLNFSEYSYNSEQEELMETAKKSTENLEATPEEKILMEEYFVKLFNSSRGKTLGEDSEELTSDPAYKLWISYKEESNYGRWMENLFDKRADDKMEDVFLPIG